MKRTKVRNRKAGGRQSPALRGGFTLLEVILAFTIFAGALAAMGEVVRLANVNARQASDMTTAQMAAQSIMTEVLTGFRELEPENDAQYMIRENQYLAYEIILEQGSLAELVGIRVRVWMNDQNEGPSFDLVRWIIDPEYLTSLTETTES